MWAQNRPTALWHPAEGLRGQACELWTGRGQDLELALVHNDIDVPSVTRGRGFGGDHRGIDDKAPILRSNIDVSSIAAVESVGGYLASVAK